MVLERAQESLRAAELCLEAELVNSAASRAYYAMFQAAQVALKATGAARVEWSHAALQAAFTTELIRRRKAYPASLRDHLSVALGVRREADYGSEGVSRTMARRIVRQASVFVATVQEGTRRGSRD